jgi:hypothetical protein
MVVMTLEDKNILTVPVLRTIKNIRGSAAGSTSAGIHYLAGNILRGFE